MGPKSGRTFAFVLAMTILAGLAAWWLMGAKPEPSLCFLVSEQADYDVWSCGAAPFKVHKGERP